MNRSKNVRRRLFLNSNVVPSPFLCFTRKGVWSLDRLWLYDWVLHYICCRKLVLCHTHTHKSFKPPSPPPKKKKRSILTLCTYDNWRGTFFYRFKGDAAELNFWPLQLHQTTLKLEHCSLWRASVVRDVLFCHPELHVVKIMVCGIYPAPSVWLACSHQQYEISIYIRYLARLVWENYPFSIVAWIEILSI